MSAQAERTREPRYTLRPTEKAFMIDKSVDQLDFPGEPFYVIVGTFGPFKTKAQATAYMMRHGGHP